jgi:hypothetical protein
MCGEPGGENRHGGENGNGTGEDAEAQANGAKSREDGAELGFLSDGMLPDTTTAEQAAQMEQELAANPEDEATREKLLHYYWQKKMEVQRVPLVLWLIDHHPESALHAHETACIFPHRGYGGDPAVFEDAWNRWLAVRPNGADHQWKEDPLM